MISLLKKLFGSQLRESTEPELQAFLNVRPQIFWPKNEEELLRMECAFMEGKKLGIQQTHAEFRQALGLGQEIKW